MFWRSISWHQFVLNRNCLLQVWGMRPPTARTFVAWIFLREKKVNNVFLLLFLPGTNQDAETIHFIGWIIERNDWMEKIVCCLIWPDTKTKLNGNVIEQDETGDSHAPLSCTFWRNLLFVVLTVLAELPHHVSACVLCIVVYFLWAWPNQEKLYKNATQCRKCMLKWDV